MLLTGKSSSRGLLLGCCLLGSYLICEKKFLNTIDRAENTYHLQNPSKIFLAKTIFGKVRSRILGHILNTEIPISYRRPIYKLLIGQFWNPWGLYRNKDGTKLKEFGYSEKVEYFEETLPQPLENYKSLGELFSRSKRLSDISIKDYSLSSIVSPCEGKVVELGDVLSDQCIQAKHATFSISAVIKDKLPENKSNSKLVFITLYLSPHNYHHFHAPSDFKVYEVKHITGECLPVFKGLASRLNDLFSVNERVVLKGTWSEGEIYYVAIAAYGVADIRLKNFPDLRTNSPKTVPVYIGESCAAHSEDIYKVNIKFKKGEEIGEFRLGSTIILLFRTSKNFRFVVNKEDYVSVGSLLGKVEDKGDISKVGA
ncbi:phosphatidylserine decarboxylase family protein [Cryptosporidium muris RN66]|uniref:phosphatidylserine decarboxylase n=1 Tax=Cryptosporidium muris (strain RN66) TaxID=441375 RepID=B6AGD2_CRYMR|nr:phosphatidylserine decarboxylase family protein [Cryptosporidium muris RN66]EEA07273.1 phosphatidylserine decarboxylase family protein [Cryptosporidium muris RN66]|eukprot:XP_002141622.1 phosphatidylserine decarboxylase family protein [Cryptosporidium muris RN66]